MKNIFLVIILLIPIQVLCWMTPVNIPNTDGCGGPAIAVDKKGYVHLVFWKIVEEPWNRQIFYCYYNGSYWSSPVNINSEGKSSGNVKITADTLCHLHVNWTDFVGVVGELYYNCHNGTTWATPVRMADILPYTSALGSGKIVCDFSNNLHLVWSDAATGNCEIYYSKFNGDIWSNPVNVSNDSQHSSFEDLAIDSKAHLHVVWMDYTGDYGVRYSKYDGISWSSSVLLPDVSSGQSCRPTITADTSNLPHIVWEERESPEPIIYTFHNGTNWSPPCTLSRLGERSNEPIVTADFQNNIHVIWRVVDSGKIYYIVCDGDSWSIPYDISGGEYGVNLDMTIDEENCLHAVWRNNSGVWYTKNQLSGVEEGQDTRLKTQDIRLLQNYPNPFIMKTEISYLLKERTNVSIIISDMVGRIVSKVDLGYQNQGEHKFILTPKEFKKGGVVCSGIYFITLKAGEYTATRRVVVVH